MTEFDTELSDFHNNIRKLGSRKNRTFAMSYRAAGSALGTVLVAIIIIFLVIGRSKI